jgi:hypothetical protein
MEEQQQSRMEYEALRSEMAAKIETIYDLAATIEHTNEKVKSVTILCLKKRDKR